MCKLRSETGLLNRDTIWAAGLKTEHSSTLGGIKVKIRIKRKLGFCEKKGCWNRHRASLDIHGREKDGELKEVIKDYCICDQHLREFLRESEITRKAAGQE